MSIISHDIGGHDVITQLFFPFMLKSDAEAADNEC